MNNINFNCNNCIGDIPQNITNCGIKNISKGGIPRLIFLKCGNECANNDWTSFNIWNNLINQCQLFMSSAGVGSKTTDNITINTSFCNPEETANQKHVVSFRVYYNIQDKELVWGFYYNLYKKQKNYKFAYLDCENHLQGFFPFRMTFNTTIDDNSQDGYQYFEMEFSFYRNGLIPPLKLPDGVFNLFLNQDCSGGNTSCETPKCYTDEFNNEFVSFIITYPPITLPTQLQVNNLEAIQRGVGIYCSGSDQSYYLNNNYAIQGSGEPPSYTQTNNTIEDLLDALCVTLIGGGYLSNAVRIGTSVKLTLETSQMQYFLGCDPCESGISAMSGVQNLLNGFPYLPIPGYNLSAINFSAITLVNGDTISLSISNCVGGLVAGSTTLEYNSGLFPTLTSFYTALFNQIIALNPLVQYTIVGLSVIWYIHESYFAPTTDCACPFDEFTSPIVEVYKNFVLDSTWLFRCPSYYKVDFIQPISLCDDSINPLSPNYP